MNKNIGNTEAKLKKSVAYKKSVYSNLFTWQKSHSKQREGRVIRLVKYKQQHDLPFMFPER